MQLKLNQATRWVLPVLLVGILLLIFSHALNEPGGATIKLRDGGRLPANFFLPHESPNRRLPAVVVAAGAGGNKLLQYHRYCRRLADEGYAVLLIDGSNFPQSLTPGPDTWRKMPYHLWSWINHLLVAARLAFQHDWYMENLRSAVDYMCESPYVMNSMVALSGFSQSANAALAVAGLDPRIKCVVWNNGGWPWIMPYKTERLPAVLIFHGEDDGVYNVKYARKLASELKRCRVTHECYIYPRQRHMFNVYYDLNVPTDSRNPAINSSFQRLVGFLNRTLIGTRKADTVRKVRELPLWALEPSDGLPPAATLPSGEYPVGRAGSGLPPL